MQRAYLPNTTAGVEVKGSGARDLFLGVRPSYFLPECIPSPVQRIDWKTNGRGQVGRQQSASLEVLVSSVKFSIFSPG